MWTAWALYTCRSVENVAYETAGQIGGIEIRRYPETMLVETTAVDERTAFRRLFRYIDGENERQEDVAMTASVRTRESGESIEMTAPVRTRESDGQTTMAFYLPESYGPETAPVPTDDAVETVVDSPRTVAVYTFSWFATDGRTARACQRLWDVLEDAGITPTSPPSLLRYDDPRTPPFLRTNEVAVDVPADAV